MGPRLKLPRYVHGYIDRHGRPRHYLRRPGRKKVPLPGLPWATDFMDAYAAAMSQAAPVILGAKRSAPGTVAEGVARYLGSGAFLVELAPSTQGLRRGLLERFRNEHGDKRLRKLQAEHVARILGRMLPHVQRNTLKALRGLMAFCLAEGLIDADPTAAVKLKPIKDTGGFEMWPVAAIERYRGRHKLGTRARLAMELLYGTMAARGDAVRLGAQHVQGGILSFRRGKTRAPVDIPILPELQAAIDLMPKAEHLAFMVTELGRPFTPTGFSNWFRVQCDLAGIPDLSAHGLRKAGATRLAEHGCTDYEIMAWVGWKTLREVQRYTAAANRKQMAMQGAAKLKAGTELANLDTRLANRGEKP
jgi:integrase